MSSVYKGVLWEAGGQNKTRASWKSRLKKTQVKQLSSFDCRGLLLEVFVLTSRDTPLRLWPGGLSHLAWPAQMFHFPLNEEPQQGVPNLIEEQPENGRVRVEGWGEGYWPTTATNETNNTWHHSAKTAVQGRVASESRTQSIVCAVLARFAEFLEQRQVHMCKL